MKTVFKNKHYCKECRKDAIKVANMEISVEKKSLQSKINLYNALGCILGVIIFFLTFTAIFTINLVYININDKSFVDSTLVFVYLIIFF